MRRSRRRWLLPALLCLCSPGLILASGIDELVAALGGSDEQARTLARQLLPREGIEVVPKLLPLLGQDKTEVREAAFRVLADIANEASAPGRDADRAAVTDSFMTLVNDAQRA